MMTRLRLPGDKNQTQDRNPGLLAATVCSFLNARLVGPIRVNVRGGWEPIY